MTVRAIVFEQITDRHRRSVGRYIKRGRRVYYLNLLPLESCAATLAELDKTGAINLLNLPDYPYITTSTVPNDAFAVNDALYDQLYANSPLVLQMVKLYGSNDVHLAFRKQLLTELTAYFRCRTLRRQVHEILTEADEIIFVPAKSADAPLTSKFDRAFDRSGMGAEVPPIDVGFHWLSRLRGFGAGVFRKSKAIALILLTTADGIFQFIRRRGVSVHETYEYAIAIISPLREFANERRGYGWLLDGVRLHRCNTVFVPVAKVSAEHVKAMRQSGLSVASKDLAAPGRVVVKTAANSLIALAYMVTAPPWLAHAAANLIDEFKIWQVFTAHYAVNNFITYADFGIRQIGRNIILNQNGTRSWYYLDSENMGFNLCYDEPYRYRHQFWGYLFYDEFVAWTPRAVDYHEAHHQKVGRYHAVGCLWAEHIRELWQGEITSGLPEKLEVAGKAAGQKIVGVFDSSYVNGSLTDYFDGVAFAEGIAKLLDEFEDIFIVWKEKKPRWILKRDTDFGLEAMYQRMAAHPRCFFVGYDAPSAEVQAVCDLVIAFPFTSSAVEALGARVKAIYFAPNEKFRGSYFEQVPDLVANNQSELHCLVDKFLYNMTADELEFYQDLQVKGAVEPYLDGLALTRFRDLLAEGK